MHAERLNLDAYLLLYFTFFSNYHSLQLYYPIELKLVLLKKDMVKVPLLGTMENEIVMPAKRMRNEQDKLPGPVLRTHWLVFIEFPSASSGGLL